MYLSSIYAAQILLQTSELLGMTTADCKSTEHVCTKWNSEMKTMNPGTITLMWLRLCLTY